MLNYRLYIDESGHHRYQLTGHISERYLSLCGIVVRQDIYKDEIIPRIEDIRSLFYSDPDLKPPLHLEDIISKKNAFSSLKDSALQNQFNKKLLSLYTDVDYKIITVVIDKTKHFNQYVTPEHPYHYCLSCVLERYYKFLKLKNSSGDVMAEARGKKEDTKLKEVYRYFYDSGTQYISGVDIQKRFTSSDIKIKTKRYLTQGLEFADLLALGTKLDVLYTYEVIPELINNFTKIVVEAIQSHYYSGYGSVKGNGKKFI